MAKVSKKVVLGILGKLGVEYSDKINLGRAKKKLERAIEKEGIEDIELSKAEIATLEAMGYELDADDEDEDGDEEDSEEIEEEESTSRKSSEKKSSKSKKASAEKKEPKLEKGKRKNEIIEAITKCISKRAKTRKEIIDIVLKRMPDVKPTTIQTHLSDGKNKKYCSFERLLVEDDKKRLSFK